MKNSLGIRSEQLIDFFLDCFAIGRTHEPVFFFDHDDHIRCEAICESSVRGDLTVKFPPVEPELCR